jgi:putative effector of murein hydrolase
MPQFAVAIEAQIDRDDASDDFIKEKLHSNIRSSRTDPMTMPYCASIGRVKAVVSLALLWFGVVGIGVGSIAGKRTLRKRAGRGLQIGQSALSGKADKLGIRSYAGLGLYEIVIILDGLHAEIEI